MLRKVTSFSLKLLSYVLQKILERQNFTLCLLSIELTYGPRTNWSANFALLMFLIGAIYLAIDSLIAPVHMLPAFITHFADRISAPKLVSADEASGPFVLYLRTFRSDRPAAAFHYGIFNTITQEAIITDEQLLCAIMSRIYGKVIGLGSPRDRLPFPGAQRLYASDDSWQKAVQDLAAKASLVMIQLSEGCWIEWELSYVAKNIPLGRIMLLVPRRQLPTDYMARIYEYFSSAQGLEEAYQKHLEAVFRDSEPVKLPTDKRWQTEYYSVICFDPHGRAHCEVTNKVSGRDETVRTMTLAEHLGLSKLFELQFVPDGTSYAGLGCCGIPISQHHEGKVGCLRDENVCKQLREAIRVAKPHQKTILREYACCPQCIHEKGLS